jgi:hypothetical protein
LCRGGSVRPQGIHDGDDGNEADRGRDDPVEDDAFSQATDDTRPL